MTKAFLFLGNLFIAVMQSCRNLIVAVGLILSCRARALEPCKPRS